MLPHADSLRDPNTASMSFDSLPRVVRTLRDLPGQNDIRGLPQFYRADLDMVWRLGGAFWRDLLGNLGFAQRWRYISVDSRSAMLMPGMFPCIPGWHCDDFYRPAELGGQPDLEHVLEDAPSEHYCLILGDSSRTVFLNSPVHLVWDRSCDDGKPIYGTLHEQIENKLRTERTRLLTLEPGQLLWFSPISWHRGAAAETAGWRHFLRLTGSNHYVPQNELRTQTQIYLTRPFQGW